MVPKSSASTSSTRLWTGLTILLGIVSGIMLVLYLITALQWRSRPYIGVMFTPLMAVDEFASYRDGRVAGAGCRLAGDGPGGRYQRTAVEP